MEYERKQKIKKGVLIGYVSITTIFTIFMIIMLAIAGVSSKKKQKASAYVQDSYYVSETYKGKLQPKYASYDPEEYTITLTANELNNYTWNNFNDICISINTEEGSGVAIPSGVSYNNSQYTNDDEYQDNGTFCIQFTNTIEEDYIEFNAYEYDNKWHYVDLEDTVYDFSYSITFEVSHDYYADIVSAIELDIQANVKSINSGIFETLTDSVVAFIGSISAGINGMISVFWADDSLTVIGTLSVIVVAVSLAYFLFRLIIGLIRMRG